MGDLMTGNENSKKYVIIHGHFYQPPRENPWIDLIEKQESAAPYHDWNERIYDQCYRPNAYSRLLDNKGMIIDINNNYLNMSYNFGPTLFSWLEQFHPVTVKKIIEADKISFEKFEGHGNAIAQVYNHIIMPLALKRDQYTQIRWAKASFKKAYGRDPEGIWLAETAINMETVCCLIDENIRFVVLSPSQAESFKPLNGNQWTSANHGIDTRRPYRIFPKKQSGEQLPGFLDVFFFDEGLSKEVSFGNLLQDSHILGSRIKSCYDEHSGSPQVVVIATDGETFGHHKPFGDMCLAYFFRKLAPDMGIVPVNYGYYLAKNPPQYEVTLRNAFGEGTAWSCAHGVGRWTRDCGCKTGGEAHWKQEWREPLRKALNNLQKSIDQEFESFCANLGCDPYKLRDIYINCFGISNLSDFQNVMGGHCEKIKSLDVNQIKHLRRLLEAQKFSLYAFTSCGWFFTDISGIETVQNLMYACRAIQLGLKKEYQEKAIQQLLQDLSSARSNLSNVTGRSLIEKHVLPFMNHEQLLAFTGAVEQALHICETRKFALFGYTITIEVLLRHESDSLSFQGYKIDLLNESTGEGGVYAVLVSHRDEAETKGWVMSWDAFNQELKPPYTPEQWMHAQSVAPIKLDQVFATSRVYLVNQFLDKIARDTETRFSAWMNQNNSVLDLLSRLGSPLPSYCLAPLSFVINQDWNRHIGELANNGNEDDVFTKLLEIKKLSDRFKIKIDYSDSVVLLENILISQFTELAKHLSGELCDRIRYILNIVDKFSLPIPKGKLEDFFQPIMNKDVRNLYKEISSSGGQHDQNAFQEKKALLLKLIGFARRMNFNTDEFKIS